MECVECLDCPGSRWGFGPASSRARTCLPDGPGRQDRKCHSCLRKMETANSPHPDGLAEGVEEPQPKNGPSPGQEKVVAAGRRCDARPESNGPSVAMILGRTRIAKSTHPSDSSEPSFDPLQSSVSKEKSRWSRIIWRLCPHRNSWLRRKKSSRGWAPYGRRSSPNGPLRHDRWVRARSGSRPAAEWLATVVRDTPFRSSETSSRDRPFDESLWAPRCQPPRQGDSRLANSTRFQGLTTGLHAGDS
jgi:hypothetical protein